MPPVTTIKVPVELRDRLGAEARAKGKTLAQFIAKLLDEYEREQRWNELGEAIRKSPPDEQYFADLRWFDALEPELPEEDWSKEPSYPEEWR